MSPRLVVAAIVLAAACSPAADHAADSDTVAPQEVTFTSNEFSFTGPDTIAPGMTNVRFVNQGHQEHHLVLARMGPEHTLQELLHYAATSANPIPEWVTFVGAANVVEPGASTTSTIDLDEGNYALVCMVEDPADGMPHIAKGMSGELVVVGERHNAPPPATTEEIRMSDLTYEIPTIAAGPHTFHMVNDGPQVHEAQMVKLNDGVTADEFIAALAPGATTPPPGKMLGGGGPLSPGEDNWWAVTLEPGNYLLICFVPDVSGTVPHFMQGMVRSFTVAAAQ